MDENLKQLINNHECHQEIKDAIFEIYKIIQSVPSQTHHPEDVVTEKIVTYLEELKDE